MTRLAHTTRNFPAEYTGITIGARARFIEDTFFRKLGRMDDRQFRQYLLERTYTSGRFIEWYNRVLVCLNGEEAKEAVRTILRDEIPVQKPTHFEDLFADLRRIGIPEGQLMSHRPSVHTLHSIGHMLECACRPGMGDLERLVFLHIAGEVLVACEYKRILDQIAARFGAHGKQLRFYTPHAEHDSQGGSHDACFVAAIERRMQDETDATAARRIANKATEARFYFFEQFNS